MKQLIRKILKEQDEVITVPDLDFFDGSWEDLLEFTRGRKFRVRGGLDLRNICPETLDNLVAVDGNLILYGCENLTSLGSLERVDGYLNLWNCENLASLGSLERVDRNLYLNNCNNLTSLGSLERVGGGLNLFNCKNLKSLGSLEYVSGYLDLYDCKNLTSLGNLEYVGGNLDLRYTPIAEKYSEEEIRKIVEVKGGIYLYL
jgi:hypothetical protein